MSSGGLFGGEDDDKKNSYPQLLWITSKKCVQPQRFSHKGIVGARHLHLQMEIDKLAV